MSENAASQCSPLAGAVEMEVHVWESVRLQVTPTREGWLVNMGALIPSVDLEPVSGLNLSKGLCIPRYFLPIQTQRPQC